VKDGVRLFGKEGYYVKLKMHNLSVGDYSKWEE
jgi:hypothetical protein